MSDVGAPCTWVLGNHDVPRVVTRYGGGAIGVRRARAAALVQLGLPGAAYVYNGDELGLPNVELPDSALRDPTWERSGHTERGRDGERVPVPWSGTMPPYGFCADGCAPWLPMPAGWAPLTVAAQGEDPASTLSMYRRALAVRRDLPPSFGWAEPAAAAETVAFHRGDVLVVLNAGTVPVPLPDGDVLVASDTFTGDELPADTAVWLRVSSTATTPRTPASSRR